MPPSTIFSGIAQLRTINEQAIVSLVNSGEFETKYRIVLNWAIPENIVDGGKRRSSRLAPYRIEMLVTLRKGARWVEFETKINNNVPNHYLQVSFPTDIDTEFVYAQGQFDVVKRPIAKPNYSLYDEIPMTEHIDRRCSSCMILRYNLECFITHRRNILNKYSYRMS